jgi:hypothetical integral membrane protein (TIGR02206 family)
MNPIGIYDTGEIFGLFSLPHIIPLLIIAALNISFIWLRKLPDHRWRKVFRWSAAILLVVNESAWHLWNAYTEQWNIQNLLPLHLCSVFVFLSAIMLVTRSYRIFEFAWFLGIGGALQPLLTPDLGYYFFPHLRYFIFFISHGLIVTSAVYMAVVEGFKPTWRSLGKVFVFGNLYLLLVFGINSLIGSNYMYLNAKPVTASLLDLLGPWPQYLLWEQLVAIVIFLLLFLPFIVENMQKKSRQSTANLT